MPKTPDFRHLVVEDMAGFLRRRFGMSEVDAKAEAERQVDALAERSEQGYSDSLGLW